MEREEEGEGEGKGGGKGEGEGKGRETDFISSPVDYNDFTYFHKGSNIHGRTSGKEMKMVSPQKVPDQPAFRSPFS